MILSDGELREAIKDGRLEITPIEDGQIQPARGASRAGDGGLCA